jgi:hypothetical protein
VYGLGFVYGFVFGLEFVCEFGFVYVFGFVFGSSYYLFISWPMSRAWRLQSAIKSSHNPKCSRFCVNRGAPRTAWMVFLMFLSVWANGKFVFNHDTTWGACRDSSSNDVMLPAMTASTGFTNT